MIRLAVFTSFLFWALTSSGVSRIGGGKVNSQSSGFEMTVPVSFADFEQVGTMIIANGPISPQSGQMIKQYLQIRDFTDYYADLSPKSRSEVEKYFVGSGWSKKTLAANPCVDVYTFKNATSTGFAATWGAGKGLTVMGPNTGLVIVTLGPLLDTLNVAPGACAWK